MSPITQNLIKEHGRYELAHCSENPFLVNKLQNDPVSTQKHPLVFVDYKTRKAKDNFEG